MVGACGHDCCELCFRRWTVDQGKRSCPVCRAALVGGPGAPLPGICLRLQRTLEQLFPEVRLGPCTLLWFCTGVAKCQLCAAHAGEAGQQRASGAVLRRPMGSKSHDAMGEVV